MDESDGSLEESSAGSESTVADELAQLSWLVLGLLQGRIEHHQLSMIQTRLLGVLRDRTPTMNELAHHLSLDKSSVTGLVDRAERRGLVERIPSTTDRRSVRVTLTEAARVTAGEVESGYEAAVAELLAVLTPADRAELARLVGTLVDSARTAHTAHTVRPGATDATGGA